MAHSQDRELDEILGITRCGRCGHRLDGHDECPFCAVVEPANPQPASYKWVYLTACFLTSPLSLYSIAKTGRLTLPEKVLAFSGCLLWLGIYRGFF